MTFLTQKPRGVSYISVWRSRAFQFRVNFGYLDFHLARYTSLSAVYPSGELDRIKVDRKLLLPFRWALKCPSNDVWIPKYCSTPALQTLLGLSKLILTDSTPAWAQGGN